MRFGVWGMVLVWFGFPLWVNFGFGCLCFWDPDLILCDDLSYDAIFDLAILLSLYLQLVPVPVCTCACANSNKKSQASDLRFCFDNN